MKVAVVKYNAGNIRSVDYALKRLGVEAVITADKEILQSADKVIFPGVGEAGTTMNHLKATGLDELIKNLRQPVFGICLGMQILFDKSFEYGEYSGLGLIKGEIRPISDVIGENLKVPHIGWNSLKFTDKKSKIFKYINDGDFVYFVHSYYASNCDESVIANAEYGANLTAAVQCGNVYGCQFHPEKSGNTGLNILRAFCEKGE